MTVFRLDLIVRQNYTEKTYHKNDSREFVIGIKVCPNL